MRHTAQSGELNAMIILKNIEKKYKAPNKSEFTAVHPLSLHIQKGEIFGLIGASGAGKSTLLRLINLLERPDKGEVWVNQQNLMTLTPEALRRSQQKIGMIFQQFNLLSNRTVAGNIAFPLELAGWKRNDIKKRVLECLDIVELSDRAQHYPAQLSGGQKQRVGIARALAPNPLLLLADEPTSALDPKSTRNILTCLQNINQKFGVCIVIVTHEMNVVREICQRAVIMGNGAVIELVDIIDKQLQITTTDAAELLDDI